MATPNTPATPAARPVAVSLEELAERKNTKFRPAIDDYVQKINDLLTEKVDSGDVDPEDDVNVTLELPVLTDKLEEVMQEVGAEFLDAGWDISWKPVLKPGTLNAILVTLRSD